MESFDYLMTTFMPDEPEATYSLRNWEIASVERGEGSCVIGDTETELPEGSVMLIPPDMVRSWRPEEDGIALVRLVISRHLASLLAEAMPELDSVDDTFGNFSEAMLLDAATARFVSRTLRKMENYTPARRAAAVVAVMTEVAASASAEVAGVSNHKLMEMARMALVRQYVSERLTADISVGEIAALLAMSPAAFCNFFRHATGLSFISYVNACRIDKACEMLRSGKFSNTEIAARCGFSNAQYFCRVFRETKQTTPRRWAAEHTGEQTAEH